MKLSQAARLRRKRRNTEHIPFESTRTRTGRPAHFKAWKQEGVVKAHLSRIKVLDLAKSIEDDEKTAAAFYLIADASPLRTVWALANADIKVIRDVPGIGPATLRRIYEYLTKNQVEVKWVMV